MFCNQLRRIRGVLGLTQREMAAELGISSSALGMYEQGRRLPGPRTAARLAAYLAKQGIPLPPLPAAPERPVRFLGRGGGMGRGGTPD